MPRETPPDALTFAQLAARWELRERTLRQRYRRGMLRAIYAYKHDGLRVFDLKSVEAFEAAAVVWDD